MCSSESWPFVRPESENVVIAVLMLSNDVLCVPSFLISKGLQKTNLLVYQIKIQHFDWQSRDSNLVLEVLISSVSPFTALSSYSSLLE